ncbi:MAG: phosphotransferase [Alphaproteobacteria bacterium]|nr:phosphotransferase [Alphaproteobacteria bacterium]
MSEALARVRALPIWSGEIDIELLSGGLSNESYKVSDGGKAYVVRFGRDFPFHHVSRDREAMVSAAAARAGLAPALVHSGPGVLVIDYIDGKTFEAGDVANDIPRITDLIHRYHQTMPKEVSGPAFMFWPFHVIRDYARTLEAGGSRMVGELPGYLELAEELERAQMPLPIIFGHNDLLPANFIDDGQRLWLIDFEYGGFSTAMFDLAGLASNAGFDEEQSALLLALYFGRQPDSALVRSHAAMQCASLLREAMWSMVSELHLDAPGADYVAYTGENLDRLAAALDSYRFRFGRA